MFQYLEVFRDCGLAYCERFGQIRYRGLSGCEDRPPRPVSERRESCVKALRIIHNHLDI
jgi:hypothetical protein